LDGVWNATDSKRTTALLQYHLLQGTVAAAALKSGPSIYKPTFLTDPTWANVTTGQNVVLAKQPSDDVVLTSSLGNRVTIIESDILFAGGLIQIIDNLLIPPARIEKTANSFKLMAFLAALYNAGLMPGFAEQANVTIFVPANTALQKVAGSLGTLTKDELARVLSYHMIPNQVLSLESLINGTSLATAATTPELSGVTAQTQVQITTVGNDVYVNSAKVVQPDILVANGVIHIVDNILNPNVSSVQPNPTIATQPPVFAVSSVAGLPFSSALPCTVSCPVTTTATSSKITTTTMHATSTQGGVAISCRTGASLAAAVGLLGIGLRLVGVA